MASQFPPQPTNAIDWANLGFRVREVNGHIECHYSVKTGKWTAPKFVADPYIRIHGMAPALNYGQQAYEGMKAFRMANGDITVFRPDRNAVRMQRSAEFISCPTVPEDLFIAAVKAAVSLNAEFVPPHETGAAMYVRPQIYGSSAQLGLAPPEEYMFCVFVMPTGVYHGTHLVKCLVLDEFDRSAPNGTGSAKIGGNYAPVLRWSDKARRDGYDITLHLDSATRSEIDEFSTSGFIGAKVDGENVTLVVPDSKNVIQSVTVESIQALGQKFGWKVECRPIKFSELPSFKEVMAAGTAAALVPIRSITRREPPTSPNSITSAIGKHERLSSDSQSEKVTYAPDSQSDEDIGPICTRLLTQLRAVQLGKVKDEFNWCSRVTREDGAKASN
ncbi:aminotransferase [Xylaria intraflava]|nr:aminotransferase [Xylaria intraflava]